jgi:hypothetical protein
MKIRNAAAMAIVAVVTVSGSAIALASIPDSSGVIHACYHPQSDGHASALSVIDTAGSHGQCPADQTELTWNQAGASVSPQLVTRDVHYDCSGDQGGPTCPDTQVFETVDCPAGTQAINGGVVKSTADQTWVDAIAVTPHGNPGDARDIPNVERTNSSNFTNPVRYSFPRLVSNGASWQLSAGLNFPVTVDFSTGVFTSYGMTVTFYAICI